MATTTKLWDFLSDAQSWVATAGNQTTMAFISGDGNPAGSLESDLTGRKKTNNNYWEIVGTWEALFGIA